MHKIYECYSFTHELCRADIPAAASVSEHGCSWVDGLSLQLLHLLQQRLPYGAPRAAKQNQRGTSMKEAFSLL